jgi:5-methylcytosine-specific restriction endonuclease McrA
MRKHEHFPNGDDFAKELWKLRGRRRRKIIRLRAKRIPRASLSSANRRKVLEETGGRCHICGGSLDGDKWHADHVLAYASGGVHSLDNYLPTHSICNSYRRSFSAEEFQWVLKLGVWLRSQIEQETRLGIEACEKFCQHQQRVAGRRK